MPTATSSASAHAAAQAAATGANAAANASSQAAANATGGNASANASSQASASAGTAPSVPPTPPSNLPNITIHPAPATSPVIIATVPTGGGETWVLMETPNQGGKLVGGNSNTILEGFGAHDWLVGGSGHNVLDPGSGENTLTAVGSSSLFVHHPGATDDATDFSPNLGDKIAVDKTISLASAQAGTITDSQAGFTDHPGLILTFSDGSHMGLADVSGPVDNSWFA